MKHRTLKKKYAEKTHPAVRPDHGLATARLDLVSAETAELYPEI